MSDEGQGRLVDGGQGPGRGDVPGAPWGAPPGSNHGGGPRTPSGLARVARNLPDPGLANYRHGGHSWVERGIAPLCDRCVELEECEEAEPGGRCAIAVQMRDELVDQVSALPHIKPEAGPLVHDYATMVVGVAILERVIGRQGIIVAGRGGERPSAAVEQRDRWSARVQSLASELGLTPAAQARLKLSKQGTMAAGILATLMQVDEMREQAERDRDERTVEGQFELPWEDGGGKDGWDASQELGDGTEAGDQGDVSPGG